MEALMPKRAVNLSIDQGLLDEAKASGVNVSAVTEDSLRRHLADLRAKRWYEDNREAIEISNRAYAKNGPWYVPDWLEE
jgi:antitoxin CcdA